MTQKRLLVVDDEDDIREVAELALDAIGGWQVDLASSGPEALAKAKSKQPDAILLDIMMPDMDGLETFHKLKKHPVTRSIPVIFLTAKAQSADQQRFLALGIAGIITKPFKAMLLPTQIKALLGWDS